MDQRLPGFAGVVRGGRYVLYVATVPVGVVADFTRLADGTGARSVVATDTAPFIAVGPTTGEYTVTTLAGPATVTARVYGPSGNWRAIPSLTFAVPACDRRALEAQRLVRRGRIVV